MLLNDLDDYNLPTNNTASFPKGLFDTSTRLHQNLGPTRSTRH